MKFNVVFRNMTPYHSAQPGVARVDLNGNFVSGARGFPCVRTRHQVIMLPNGEEWKRTWVPIMPANSLRHALRERIAQRYLDTFRGKHTLSLGAYAAMLSGNATGNPDGAPAPFSVIQKTRQHPFLGLFGGGPRMIEGKLVVDQAIPIISGLQFYLPDAPMDLALPQGGLTEVIFRRRVDPVLKLTEERMELIEGVPDSVDEWFQTYYSKSPLVKQAKESKPKTNEAGSGDEEESSAVAGEGDSDRGLTAFNAHEVVVPGVPWLWHIDSKAELTRAQIGALLDGIAQLHGERLGGMSALGYGKIEIISISLEGKELWDAQGASLHDEAGDYLEAWLEAIDATPERFEKFVQGDF